MNYPFIASNGFIKYLSEDELAGSYNWDYLLDWGPQYQPLAHVFKEISRLRDDEDDDSTGTDTAINSSQTLRMAPQSNISFMRYAFLNIVVLKESIIFYD